jgi:hypothetical protein
MRALSTVEILQRAHEEAASKIDVIERTAAETLKAKDQAHEQELVSAVEGAVKNTLDESRADIRSRIARRAERYGRRVVLLSQLLLGLCFAVLIVLDEFHVLQLNERMDVLLKIMLVAIAIVHFLDLIGVEFISSRFAHLRAAVAERRERALIAKWMT